MPLFSVVSGGQKREIRTVPFADDAPFVRFYYELFTIRLRRTFYLTGGGTFLLVFNEYRGFPKRSGRSQSQMQ